MLTKSPVTANADTQQAGSMPLVAVVGATGTGKSAFALDLVHLLVESGYVAEIINADAMQLYRGMDIGTAKLPVEARRGIPHHVLDIWEVTTEASVADYQRIARAQVLDCLSRGVIPILVGGSGLYVSSVLYEFEFPGTDKEVRARWEHRLATEGIAALMDELRRKDPLAAAAIDPQNSRRVIRALEVIEITGQPFGAGLDAKHHQWLANQVVLGLAIPRDELVKIVDKRVEDIWAAGLVLEVEGLIPHGIERGVTASRAIGYQQALKQWRRELTEAEAVAETQALTRRYARRQVSWFGRDNNTVWFDSREQSHRAQAVSAILQAVWASSAP